MTTRLINTSEDLPQKDRNEILNDFTSKLIKSGYSKKQTHEIVEGGVVGYERRKENLGGISHRDPKDTVEEREYKKLT